MKNVIYKCENCGKEHDGSYGSGRFCCSSCRVSFTNKLRGKMKQSTKDKITNTWNNKEHKLYKCKICNKYFYRHEGYNTSRVFCSKECHNNWENNRNNFVNYELGVLNANKTKRINKTFKSYYFLE